MQLDHLKSKKNKYLIYGRQSLQKSSVNFYQCDFIFLGRSLKKTG